MTTTNMIKILAISPFPGLETTIKNVSEEFPDIEVIYESGELQKGVDIALQYTTHEIDAIISRGGTARMIGSAVKIPTFDIGISTNDLINTIALAKNTQSKKMCLVGFSEVTNAAKYLYRLLDRPLEIYVTETAQENIELMHKLKNEGMELVIGDATSVRFATNEGINNIMISSGEDSVRSCFKQILTLKKMSATTEDMALIQRNILKNLNTSFFIISENGECIHSQASGENLAQISLNIMQEISISFSQKFLNNQIQDNIHFEKNNSSWLLTFKPDFFRNKKVIIVIWTKLNTLNNSVKSLIKDLSKITYPFEFESFNSADNKMSQAISDGKTFAQTTAPILISGEPFTGRHPMANMIYKLSSFGKGGFYGMDALNFTPEVLKILFEKKDSFLTSLSLTLVIKNLQHIDFSIAKLFLEYIKSSGFCKHSRLICLFDQLVDITKEDIVALTRFLLTSLGSLVITIPPLRERKSDLMFLATLSLGQFCNLYGKNCSGFTAEAKDYILNLPWHGNLHELRGIIRHVAAMLQGDSVTEELLKQEMSKWNSLYEKRPENIENFLQGSLEEIENKIILNILREENFHKTKVASRLKISRNTLWRKMKEIGLE